MRTYSIDYSCRLFVALTGAAPRELICSRHMSSCLNSRRRTSPGLPVLHTVSAGFQKRRRGFCAATNFRSQSAGRESVPMGPYCPLRSNESGRPSKTEKKISLSRGLELSGNTRPQEKLPLELERVLYFTDMPQDDEIGGPLKWWRYQGLNI
uniref:Uncharacterized protein n=1 Tax=Tetraselmis sp. GSL018 TaxID=582737 RepID=A0A061RUU9_9CHLO